MVPFRRADKRLNDFLKRTDDQDASTYDCSSSELPSRFSRQFGKDHTWILGQKMLLEFDPTSTYEKAIEDFVLECKGNGEAVMVLTEKGSPICSRIRTRKNVKLFYMTSQVSAPKEISKNEVLLPWSYGSVVLDALNKDLENRLKEKLSTICDNLSGSILAFGLERTYSFLKLELELVISPRITHMTLLNATAHDPKEVATIEGLFNNILIYGKQRLRAVRLANAKTEHLSHSSFPAKSQ